MYTYVNTFLTLKSDIKIRGPRISDREEGRICQHLAALYALSPTQDMDISMLAKSYWGKRLLFKARCFASSVSHTSPCRYRTFRRGLSLVSIMKSYLQSSQQRVSELLIHWWRQDWWTKRRVPVQRQGVMSGLSSSPSQ